VIISRIVCIPITAHLINKNILSDEDIIHEDGNSALAYIAVSTSYSGLYGMTILGIYLIGTMKELGIMLMEAASVISTKEAKMRLGRN